MNTLRQHALDIAAFLWGVAEATLFFFVPDVLLSYIGVKRGVRATVRASIIAAAGAAIGGAFMYLWSAVDFTAARDAVLMNADDAARLHLVHGDPIVLRNALGTFGGRVFLAPIAAGNLQIHGPEGNHLIDRDRRDADSDTPDYTTRVRIEKVATPVGA